MRSETGLAYFAGLLDGEGHIGITTARTRNDSQWRTHSVIVTVSNTFLPVLVEIRDSWKGTLVVRTQRQSPTPIGNLRWSAKRAYEVLRALQPYLRIKVKQCALALTFAEEQAKRPHSAHPISREEWERREELRMAIRQLNRLDPTLKVMPFPERPGLICAVCGDTFDNYRSRKAKYCSNSCAQKARWQRFKAKATL